MLKKENSKSSAKMIIGLIVIGVMLLLSITAITAFIFRDEITNMILKNKSYTEKDILVTEEILMRDIDIIMAKEGVQGQVLLLKNESSLDEFLGISFKDTDGKLKEGNIISVGILNRIFTDSKKLLEIRFINRIMLYLRERKTDTEVGNIVGIAGSFTRSEIFEGECSQLIKMSVEEFENLYKEANVSELDTKKQIDILTDLWVKKTRYWRRGLFDGEDIRVLDDMVPKEKLYCLFIDYYSGRGPGAYTFCERVIKIYNDEITMDMLNENEKEVFEELEKICRDNISTAKSSNYIYGFYKVKQELYDKLTGYKSLVDVFSEISS